MAQVVPDKAAQALHEQPDSEKEASRARPAANQLPIRAAVAPQPQHHEWAKVWTKRAKTLAIIALALLGVYTQLVRPAGILDIQREDVLRMALLKMLGAEPAEFGAILLRVLHQLNNLTQTHPHAEGS